LERRWAKFTSAPALERPNLFVTGTSGRNVETNVRGLKRLADVTSADAPQDVGRYGFRSFDRQWAFEDPRMAKTESPSLWQSLSENQLFLSSPLTAPVGEGPALTVSPDVPDLHYFSGRGGKDIVPLYRDAAANEPNLPAGLPATLARLLGIDPPSVED